MNILRNLKHILCLLFGHRFNIESINSRVGHGNNKYICNRCGKDFTEEVKSKYIIFK